MKTFVRFAALYNITGALAFVIPGVLPLLGILPPYSTFWQWLPALFASFAGIVLFFSSYDLEKYGSFPYWNGYVRLTFVILTFLFNFGGTVGAFITLLALGDLVLALGCIFGVPRAANRGHLALLTNR